MTKEEAIKIIDDECEHIKHHLTEKGKAEEFYIELGNMVIAFNMAINALEQEPKWIKTSEKMPPVGEWVLTTTGETLNKTMEIEAFVGRRTNRRWRLVNDSMLSEEYEYNAWTSGHGDIGHGPEYWMPLPKLPKEIE